MEKRKTTVIFAFGCALSGLAILLTSIRSGAGVGGDATIYIASAENFLDGRGLGLINPAGTFRLIPYFPPLYSLFLAGLGKLGLNIAYAAGIANAIIFGLTIFLVSWHMGEISQSPMAGLFLGLTLCASPILIPAYSWAMSEPLCILLGFGGLISLERYLKTDRKWALFFSALFCGLSFLTRYSSAAFLLTGGFVLLFLQRAKVFRRRALDALVFSLISVAPMLIWLIYDVLITGTLASRSANASGSLWMRISAFFFKMKDVVYLWFFPDSWTNQTPPFLGSAVLFLIGLIVAACFGVALMKSSNNPFRADSARMTLILSVFFFAYILVILIVALATWPPITIGSRMFLPVYIAFLEILFLGLISLQQKMACSKAIRFGIYSLTAGFIAFSGLRGVRIARQNAIDGLGYNSRAWRESETVERIREMLAHEPNTLIITNEETALLFLLNQPSWPMREVYVNEPDKAYYAYDAEGAPPTDYGRQAFIDENGVLAVFDTFDDQMADIYGQDTQRRVDALFSTLELIFDGDDGKIYRKKESK